MTDYNRNPAGKGGFQPGQSANPSGRPRSTSRIQIAALAYCLEAIEIMMMIAREGGPRDAVRLAAANAILDRGVGKAVQALDIDMSLSKKLSEMNEQELIELREKYQAVAVTAPALVEYIDREASMPELDLTVR